MIDRRDWARGAGWRLALLVLLVALALPLRMASASCGDGVLDQGEPCDAGADPSGTCCTALCTFALPGTTCRPAAGDCDLPETCSGLSATCPTNVFRPAEECRPAAGPCDLPEVCSGVGPACPADSFVLPGVVCRPSTSACDVAESCTGSSIECPADSGQPDTDQDGICDALDLCPSDPDPLQVDGDGDGVGDACDPCTNVGNSTLDNPRLAFSKLGGMPGDDRIRLKANFFVPNTPSIDPVHKGLRLIVGGSLGLVFDAVIPPGKFDASSRIGWQASADGGRWLYKNGSGVPTNQAGIYRILLRADHAFGSQLRIAVAGRGANLSAAAGQSSLTVTVIIDAPIATTGQCSEAQFVTTGNGSECRVLNGGHRLECRKDS